MSSMEPNLGAPLGLPSYACSGTLNLPSPTHTPHDSSHHTQKYLSPICPNSSTPCSTLPTSVCLLPKAPRKRRHPSDLDLKYPCPVAECGRKYALENSLRQHLRKHHGMQQPMHTPQSTGNMAGSPSLRVNDSPVQAPCSPATSYVSLSPPQMSSNTLGYQPSHLRSVKSVPTMMNTMDQVWSTEPAVSPYDMVITPPPCFAYNASPEGVFTFKQENTYEQTQQNNHLPNQTTLMDLNSPVFAPQPDASTKAYQTFSFNVPSVKSEPRPVAVDIEMFVSSLMGEPQRVDPLKCSMDRVAIDKIEQELMEMVSTEQSANVTAAA
eukprot:comp18735_c0_seq1/m.20535 comp18735_c0_seq1/g.20535  ORF comp18735_c0_seq1/g.20535 comp18735_c0_seq1/m.20535 type:complete len:323 (-) comp18735_c0_seq1:344-1312(-)